MKTLTINIEDQSTEKSVKAFLDKLGLKYIVNAKATSYEWWKDEELVDELNSRSQNLKSAEDKGYSLSEIKKNLSRR